MNTKDLITLGFPPGDALKLANAHMRRLFAAGLDRAAPLAIRGAKAAMHALRLPPPVARREAADIFARLWFTDAHREAEAAFAEKRESIFHGR